MFNTPASVTEKTWTYGLASAEYVTNAFGREFPATTLEVRADRMDADGEYPDGWTITASAKGYMSADVADWTTDAESLRTLQMFMPLTEAPRWVHDVIALTLAPQTAQVSDVERAESVGRVLAASHQHDLPAGARSGYDGALAAMRAAHRDEGGDCPGCGLTSYEEARRARDCPVILFFVLFDALGV